MADEATQDQPTPEETFLNSFPDEADQLARDAGLETSGENKSTEQATVAEQAAPDSDEGTTQADSFTERADLDALLSEISDPAARTAVETAYKSFQGDYTRSKQALAEERRALGDLDPALAAEAVQFYTNLQEDPAFALEVYEYLDGAFQAMGMKPEAAAEAAAEEVTRRQEAGQYSNSEDEDPDSPLKAELDTVRSRLDAFEAQAQERAAQEEEDYLAASLLTQEMALRQARPTLTDEDMDDIYDFALAYGGNLVQAAQRLDKTLERRMTGYIEQKATVSDAVTTPAPGSSVEAPDIPKDERGNVDLEAVHRLAMSKLINHMANKDG